MVVYLNKKPISPVVFLAPLAGITDLPFRNLVSSFGAGLVVSEMIASQEMVQAKQGVREKAELGFGSDHTAVQLAGREAYWMSEAAKMAQDNGAQLIDINMGCPAKKVVNGYSGSALLKDLDHALTLIDAVVAAVSVPVTLKTRLGWDDQIRNAPDLARRAEGAGIAMITIHGRTRCQFYKGKADWVAIADVSQAVDIPVIANGDITTYDDIDRCLEESGADGVMIGRGSYGRPWFLSHAAHYRRTGERLMVPDLTTRIGLIERHYAAMLDFYGYDLAVRNARKHFKWYLRDIPGGAATANAINRTDDPATVVRLLRALADTSDLAKAA